MQDIYKKSYSRIQLFKGYRYWCVMLNFLIFESVSDLTRLVTLGKKRDLWESEKQEEMILRQQYILKYGNNSEGQILKGVVPTNYRIYSAAL